MSETMTCGICGAGMTEVSHGFCLKCGTACGCSFAPTSMNDYCERHRPFPTPLAPVDEAERTLVVAMAQARAHRAALHRSRIVTDEALAFDTQEATRNAAAPVDEASAPTLSFKITDPATLDQIRHAQLIHLANRADFDRDQVIEKLIELGVLYRIPRAPVAPPPASSPAPSTMECRDCDGCGWNEGGASLQTPCAMCKGTGVVLAVPARETLTSDARIVAAAACEYLSVRTASALNNAGHATVGAVLALPEEQLTRVRNLGRVGRDEVARLRTAMDGPYCSVTATVDATTRRCGNNRGHPGDCWFLSNPDMSASPALSSPAQQRCDRCGQLAWQHQGIELFCPFISTFRAALSVAPTEDRA